MSSLLIFTEDIGCLLFIVNYTSDVLTQPAGARCEDFGLQVPWAHHTLAVRHSCALSILRAQQEAAEFTAGLNVLVGIGINRFLVQPLATSCTADILSMVGLLRYLPPSHQARAQHNKPGYVANTRPSGAVAARPGATVRCDNWKGECQNLQQRRHARSRKASTVRASALAPPET